MKLKIIITAAMLTLIMCGSAFADTAFMAKGSATVPGIKYWYISGSSNLSSNLYVTNITSTAINCKVTVFDHLGTDVTADCKIQTGNYNSDYSTTISTGSGEFLLPAGGTNCVRILGSQTGKVIYGHAVIEWCSVNTKIKKALIATADRTKEVNAIRAYSSMIPINGGMPF